MSKGNEAHLAETIFHKFHGHYSENTSLYPQIELIKNQDNRLNVLYAVF